jgi:hypothetical protein
MTEDPGIVTTIHPDPTKLTIELINREIAALKELVFVRINVIDRDMAKIPLDVEKAIAQLQILIETRLTGMQTQFRELRR